MEWQEHCEMPMWQKRLALENTSGHLGSHFHTKLDMKFFKNVFIDDRFLVPRPDLLCEKSVLGDPQDSWWAAKIMELSIHL